MSIGKAGAGRRGQGCCIRHLFWVISGALCLAWPRSLCVFVLPLLLVLCGLPLTFCGCNLTKSCFPGACHLPSWGFPANADLLSAFVEAVRKWGGVCPPWSKPLAIGEWEEGNKSFPLRLSDSQLWGVIIHVASWKLILGGEAINHAWSQGEGRSVMHNYICFPTFPDPLSFPSISGEQKNKVDPVKLMEMRQQGRR